MSKGAMEEVQSSVFSDMSVCECVSACTDIAIPEVLFSNYLCVGCTTTSFLQQETSFIDADNLYDNQGSPS